MPGSWVDEALREHHCDLLFRIPLRGPRADSHEGVPPPGVLLYVLFEHQSTVESHMALKVHRYLTRVLDDWSREHLRRKLPPVLARAAIGLPDRARRSDRKHRQGARRAPTGGTQLTSDTACAFEGKPGDGR